MYLEEELKKYNLILASQSPRRNQLLKDMGFSFRNILPENIEEIYPAELKNEAVAIYLAELKSEWFKTRIQHSDIVITADTIVVFNDKVYGKPESRENAIQMLKELSGNMHVVYTGVCLYHQKLKHTFFDQTQVKFKEFTDDEIVYYIDKHKPYDKAGSYGAQEWLGYIGIHSIKGSYFNVMGLPTHKIYEELIQFIEKLIGVK